MDCPATSDARDAARFLSVFGEKALREGTPLSGSVDLTDQCNLACVHCYGGDRARAGRFSGGPKFADLARFLDQAADAGCLFLLFTGGECLLRPDFPELYARAAGLGMRVTVFTNGTLVTPDLARLFREFPPHGVEISLYGLTPEVHDGVTRVPGSLARSLAGFRLLSEAGVRLAVKTILMAQNRQEFFDLERFAVDNGARFRFDPAVFPRLNGDPGPVEYRVSPAEAVEKDLSDPGRLGRWKDYWDRDGGRKQPLGTGCGAGRNSFHLDSAGRLVPCLMMGAPAVDALEPEFSRAWQQLRAETLRAGHAEPEECRGCGKKILCDFCPAFFALETGSARERSAFVCEMAGLRHGQVTQDRRNHERPHQREAGQAAL
ncbi:MAG: radical SAM protein [Proteobacteria bacterium]|nr:radical SAM protein [Pseudomonadota bacterium]